VLERALQAIVPVAFAQQRMPVRVGGNIQLPVKVTSVNPLCPNAPIPATGTVVRLIGRIGVNGSVTDVKPIPAAPEDTPRAEFIASAVDAVRQWTFTPTLLNGQPTEASMVVVVRYQM
jgi:protein TonB